jgi:hypothetical protein
VCQSKFPKLLKRFRKAENKLLDKIFMHFNFRVTFNTWIIFNNGEALMKFILFHRKNNCEMCVQCINITKKSRYCIYNRNFMVNQNNRVKILIIL